MTYANITDVVKRLGRPISEAAEIAQVNAWLEDIVAIITAAFARAGLDLAAQVALGDPSLATVVRIESAAVIRKMQNPDGITSITRSIDDASITERREGAVVNGADILADEWRDLLPTVNAGAFSTRPGFTPDYVPAATSYPFLP